MTHIVPTVFTKITQKNNKQKDLGKFQEHPWRIHSTDREPSILSKAILLLIPPP